MKLSQLVKQYKKISKKDDMDIDSVCAHTEKVKKNSLYIALIGNNKDGHEFINQAIELGAVAVVTSKKIEHCSVMQIVVPDTRVALSYIANAYYGYPTLKLKIIGLTGTNGKTTISYMLQHILKASNKAVAIIGTNGTYIGDRWLDTDLTTPDPMDLYAILLECVLCDIEYVVMEVSAHGIYYHKIDAINFEVVAFSNISQDHLDFFGSMSEYKNVKASLFNIIHAKQGVVNVDDELGQELVMHANLPITTYGIEQPSDVFLVDLVTSSNGNIFTLNCLDNIAKIKSCLPGKFNAYNALCAIAVATKLGLELKKIVLGIRNTIKIDGRFNIINNSKFCIIIDFAHTPDGLNNVLNTIREFALKRIITVFGCGGNRDTTKRAIMGKVASELSDFVIITSDNPRYEEPTQIINQIWQGIPIAKRVHALTNVDRKQAIATAIQLAKKDDIIFIAGKGAEKTQEILGEFIEYNDYDYTRQLIEDLNL